jgi:hypothetical protein
MAQYTHGAVGYIPAEHADGASSLVDNTYQAVRTTTASTLRVVELFIGGEATASTVNRMALRRLSTNAITPTNQTPAALNPLSAASVSQGYVAAGTGPTIASTQHLTNMALNVFGGVIRWVAAPGEEVYATASAVPNGELVLDSISGVGPVSTDIKFEEM